MKRLALICAAAAAMFAVACKPEFKEVAVSSVKVTPDKLTLQVGTTGTLSAEVLPKDATKPAVKWASDNESVATVADDGTVTAVAEGTATVTAEADGVAGNAVVTVTPLPVPYVGTLSSEAAENGVVSAILTIGKDPVSVSWTYSLDRPAAEARTFALSVDEALVATYNSNFAASAELLPDANYEFSAREFIIAAGAQSADITVLLRADDLDISKTYVLPLSAPGAEEGDAMLVGYVVVNAREASESELELSSKYITTVVYIDTRKYNPLLITDTSFDKIDGNMDVAESYLVGNIVNLKYAKLSIESSTGIASLKIDDDLQYLLNHRGKYIMPIQDPGRKVCITIETDNNSFCILNDEQIVSFVQSIKSIVSKYNLDGVNLWDHAEISEITDKTAYPKLIKSLKESLGNKIVTVVDYEAPTSYFDDLSSMGNIEIGKYIDYMWSGYCSEEESLQIIDPWNQGKPCVSSTHTRKVVIGLDKNKYGALTVPIFKTEEIFTKIDPMSLGAWYGEKLNPSNLFVINDIITNPQGAYEGAVAMEFSMIFNMMFEDSIEIDGEYEYGINPMGWHMHSNPSTGYDAWLKDWGTND